MLFGYYFRKFFILFLFWGAGIGLAFGEESGEALREGSGGLDIRAEGSIEWHRLDKKYTAEDSVVIRDENFTINSDSASAFYREVGDTQGIYRLQADDNVVVDMNGVVISADRLIYELPKTLIVLRGDDLLLRFEDFVMTAGDSMEYWRKEQLAIARGGAVIKRSGQVFSADVVSAKLTSIDGVPEIESVTAERDVVIESADTVIRGDSGYYDFAKEVSTICGDVSIIREGNQLSGHCATVDMRTGLATLQPLEDGGRVSGSITQPQEGSGDE